MPKIIAASLEIAQYYVKVWLCETTHSAVASLTSCENLFVNIMKDQQ